MKYRMFVGLALFVFIAAMAFAQTGTTPESKKPGKMHETTATADLKTKHSEPVLERIKSAKNLSTFAALLKEAGLEEALSGAGPYTVFAPNDDAFKKLPPDQMAALKADKAKLADLLKYHIITGQNLSMMELDKMTSPTLKADNGADLTIGKNGGKVAVNGTVLRGPNLHAANGTIHSVHNVLMPGVTAPAEMSTMPEKHGGPMKMPDTAKPAEPAPTPPPTPQGK